MRKARPKKRIILPDPKFNDILVTKFVNNLMYQGKKNTAFNIFYEAIDTVAEKSSENGLEVFKKALSNITPQVEVRSRRIGGATFQIPQEIRAERKQSISIKNLILFSRKRHEKSMSQKLAGEILSAFKEEGAAFKRKEDIHRMAEANKAFSHFRF
ncbi:MAG: 30S ribosomal protein S7 [Bacteroidota bacterium]|nr:30S ribosomal protein S7 [Bacteroidota bacterium]